MFAVPLPGWDIREKEAGQGLQLFATPIGTSLIAIKACVQIWAMDGLKTIQARQVLQNSA